MDTLTLTPGRRLTAIIDDLREYHATAELMAQAEATFLTPKRTTLSDRPLVVFATKADVEHTYHVHIAEALTPSIHDDLVTITVPHAWIALELSQHITAVVIGLA